MREGPFELLVFLVSGGQRAETPIQEVKYSVGRTTSNIRDGTYICASHGEGYCIVVKNNSEGGKPVAVQVYVDGNDIGGPPVELPSRQIAQFNGFCTHKHGVIRERPFIFAHAKPVEEQEECEDHDVARAKPTPNVNPKMGTIKVDFFDTVPASPEKELKRRRVSYTSPEIPSDPHIAPKQIFQDSFTADGKPGNDVYTIEGQHEKTEKIICSLMMNYTSQDKLNRMFALVSKPLSYCVICKVNVTALHCSECKKKLCVICDKNVHANAAIAGHIRTAAPPPIDLVDLTDDDNNNNNNNDTLPCDIKKGRELLLSYGDDYWDALPDISNTSSQYTDITNMLSL